MTLYDRAAQRGDPFEERIKLALKAVLAGPDFLFKLEHRSEKPGIYPIGQYELASRLSYFLWSTMPDDELNNLAAQGRLQDPKVLAAQVDRMLDDPRSRTFTSTFIGQWLGTQDVGGRAGPDADRIAGVLHIRRSRPTCAPSRYCSLNAFSARTAASWNCSPPTTPT